MSDHDELLRTIETIYAGGLETESESGALAAASRLLGALGATMEVIDKPARRHTGMWVYGLPTTSKSDYVEQFAAISPRIPFGFRQPAGHVGWDYQILDEAGLAHNAFYADFLPRVGIRYFLAAILKHTPEEFAVFCVHRTRKEGHVDDREIALMRALTPHLQQAHDMATRLRGAELRAGAFERALDWVTDGAALLRNDGRVLYSNEAFDAIARRNDGLRIARGALEFAAPEARVRFAAALAAICRLHGSDPEAGNQVDFPAPRAAGMPAYIVSLRPLVGARTSPLRHDAVATVFVRDPLGRNTAGARMLRELFGLTDAEASLAQALQSGIPLGDYARDNAVTLNTVYTHLRRIKEKTGCSRIAKLHRKLKELEVPLASD
jgi:DNA-binding CsgD family transcriptional regulator